MKTLKSIIVIVLVTIFSFTSVFSSETSDDKNSLNKQIQSLIKYPKNGFEAGLEGKVFIVYRVTEDNTIQVDNAFSSNSELKLYVINSLEGKKIESTTDNVDKQYTISVVFNFVD